MNIKRMFKKFFKSNSEKKDSVNKEFLRSEKTLVRARLENAINVYFENPNEENVVSVCQELIYAYIYNLTVNVSVSECDISETGVRLPMLENKACNLVAYEVYTTGPEHKNDDIIVAFSVRKLFEEIEESSTAGLIINNKPGQDVVLFLNNENIRSITNYAKQNIDMQPPSVRDFLKKEI